MFASVFLCSWVYLLITVRQVERELADISWYIQSSLLAAIAFLGVAFLLQPLSATVVSAWVDVSFQEACLDC